MMSHRSESTFVQLGLELLDDVDQAAYALSELVHTAPMDVGVVDVDGQGWLTVRV